MKGRYKKFEPGLYTQYDGPAKVAVATHLKIMGHEVTVPPENYGPDLHSTYLYRKMYHEVEVSQMWFTAEHPWAAGSVPERKKRLLSKLYGCELFFWMLRKDLKRALVFPSTIMNTDDWLVEVPNKKIESGEYFYRPPKILGKEFDIYG